MDKIQNTVVNMNAARPDEIAAAAAALGMTIEEFMQKKLGQQGPQTDDRLVMIKEAVADLSSREKLRQNSVFDQKFYFYMMKFSLVDRAFLGHYENIVVDYRIEKTKDAPFYRVVSRSPDFTKEQVENQVRTFRELTKDFMELRISLNGQGRKDKKEILSGLSQDQMMTQRMGLIAGLRNTVGGWMKGPGIQ
jgi:hypothetical protein